MKQFGNPPLSKMLAPPISTNPPISEQFFHDPLFVQILKTRTTLILGGRKLCTILGFLLHSLTKLKIYSLCALCESLTPL